MPVAPFWRRVVARVAFVCLPNGAPLLPRLHRVVDGSDFKRVQRAGRKYATEFFVVYSRATGDGPARFGFVASKEVGGAVVRNRVRRQLRECAASSIREGFTGRDVVVRILPAAKGAGRADLEHAWRQALAEIGAR